MRVFLMIWCFFLVFTGGFAQKNNSKLYNYFDGIPSDDISFVFTTSSGKLNFCTRKGIIQFDGQRFDLIYPTNQAVLNAFFSNDVLIYEDGQGLQSLQFGRELVCTKIQTKNYMDADPNNDHFENIYVDSEKRIWSTDFNNVKYIFENKIQYFHLFPQNKKLDIQVSFVEVSKNEIWLFTSNNVYRWFNNNIEDISYYFKDKFEFKKVIKCKGEIIFATTKEVISYNISTKQFSLVYNFEKNIDIKELYHFEHAMYVLTDHELFRLTDGDLELVYSNDDLQLKSFNYDNQSRNYWLGSQQGLIQIHLPNSALYTIHLPKENAEKSNFILDVASLPNNQFYLISSKNQLFFFDGKKLDYKFSLPNSLQVRSLLYKDKLYVTTTKGVYSYDGFNLEKLPLQNFYGNADIVKSIIVKNEIWLLFKHAAILKFNLLSGKNVEKPFRNDYAFWKENLWYDLILDKNFNVWLLGWMPKGFGINLLNKERNVFEDISMDRFQNNRNLFVGDYYLNGFDSKKHLYFSAFGGFNVVNYNGKLVEKVDVFSHAIDDTHISSIVTDVNENVFFSSNAGLHVFVKKHHKVIKLNTTDGLPSNSLHNAFKLLENSNLLVGFENKFTMIDLKGVLESQLRDKFEITKVLINGEVFPTTNKLILSKDQNNISIYFSTFSYLDKSKIFYKYRINKEEWIDLGNQSALMFNYLPPGTYHIEVVAIDHLGNQQNKVLNFTIDKKPAFTQSNLFYGLLTLFVLLLVFVLFKYSVYRKTKEKHYQLKVKEAEMKMLRAQMNPHFMFNTLNSINSYIIQNKTDDASKYLGTFSKLMRNILESSKQQFIPLVQEIKTTKLYLQLEAVRLDHIFDFKIIIDDLINIDEVLVPPLIVQPFAENAIWHGLRHVTNRKGILVIRFMIKSEDTLLIEIEDNGIGRKKSNELKINKKHQSYGVQITEERIKNLNAFNRLTIDDLYDGAIARGTKISIYLKLD